jgi:phage terminase large subunit
MKNALVLVPPECASFEAELALRGIWHMDADNDVADGIKLVSSLMALRKIRFSRERCPKTISKLPAYAWDPKKALRGIEEPIKQNDDECDAVRYFAKTRIPWWRVAGVAA